MTAVVAVAVAMAGADYNQQRAAKTVVAAIASIVAAAATTVAAAVAAVAMKGADYNQQRGKDSMYTVRVPHLKHSGPNVWRRNIRIDRGIRDTGG